jgi:hypothetical protein
VTPHRSLPFGLLVACLLLGGCAGEQRGSLDAQPGTPSPTCLVHQTRRPGGDYTAGRDADTRSVLEMMRYYTVNGTKPYCDGEPPGSADRAWTDLYTSLGGDRSHVPSHPTP